MRQLVTTRNPAAALPRNIFALSALLLASFFSSSAFAATFKIDAFEIGRCSTSGCDPTTNVFFADEFNAGGPPPNAPNFTSGNAATYFVNGSFPGGSEAGNKLTLNTANGIAGPNASGAIFNTISARLLSDTDPTQLNLGLKAGSTFSVFGLFDLPSTFQPNSGFDIRFFERNSSSTVRQVQMRVGRDSGSPFVRFQVQDFLSGTLSQLGQFDLDLAGTPDQIGLEMVYRPGTGVTGRFGYLSGGDLVGTPTSFTTPTPLFLLSSAVTAGFAASEAAVIPVPSAALLLMPGVLVLIGLARSNRKARS